MKKGFFILFIFFTSFSIVRSQSNVNPDISLIGQFKAYTLAKGDSLTKGKLNLETPSLEMFIEGYLNPYARATANIAFEEGEFVVEELYAHIVRGLPLDMQLKAGQFLLGFGKLNTSHPHIWPFLERPLYQQVFLGEEGFNDIGVNLSFVLPTETFFSSFDIGIFKGNSIGGTEADDPESQESIDEVRGNSPIVIGRLGAFFNLSDFSNLETGISFSYGTHRKHNFNFVSNPNQTKSLNYLYGGLDLKYKYKPDTYTSLTIHGEGLINRRDVVRSAAPPFEELEKINTYGGFIMADYQFYKQYSIGVKYDYTKGIAGDEPGFASLANDDKNNSQAVEGWIGYYPVEETLALRAGVQHIVFNFEDGSSENDTKIQLQLIFSLGPHKAHPF